MIVRIMLSLLVDYWGRANNLVITVADTVDTIYYYNNPTGVMDLCGILDGQLNASAYIRCGSIIAGQYVQVQNDILAGYSFHLSEVEVFGF